MHPTAAGYIVEEQAVAVAVVEARVMFPLSKAEASHPVMRHSLEAGFAQSIGIDPSKVGVIHIDGVAVGVNNTGATALRRLNTNSSHGVDITFAVQSASNKTTNRPHNE